MVPVSLQLFYKNKSSGINVLRYYELRFEMLRCFL